jgi:hypothetical protein
MSDERRVDPASLRSSGAGLQQGSQDLRERWNALKSKAEGQGDIFGDDLIGGLIGVAYQSVSAAADDAFGSAGDDLDYTATGLNTIADDNDAVEEDGKRNVDTVGEAI